MDITSEIDKLKHFHIEDYSGIYFTDELNAGELNIKVMRRRFYSFNNRFRTTKNTEAIVFENGGFVGNLGLSKKLWKKYIEASYKYRTNTDKMTASDYTHLFGYLNPYYRSAYNVSKRRK